MKLVQFENGKYGIRRGWLCYSYLDLVSKQVFWWVKSDGCFKDCQVTHQQEAIDGLKVLKRKCTDTVIRGIK